MSTITVTETKTRGKRGAEHTVHMLSNGWWITEWNHRNKGDGSFTLFKPRAGGSPLAVKAGTKFDSLLAHAKTLAQQSTEKEGTTLD